MSFLLAQAATNAAGGGAEDVYLFWGFVLFGAALLMVLLEFLLPSGGLIAVLAGVAAIGSVLAFFRYDATWGIVAALSYVILGPIISIFGFRLWLNSPLARGMILGGNDPQSADGEEESPLSSEHARRERLAQLQPLIGAHGVAVTSLRPVGIVKIDGQRIDALAESGVIDAGTPIVVTEIYDNQIKVRML